ncbi:MAG TPA: hypothetical protein VJZ27_08675, partial [Aggregatilineales bacterium]|nr:hypothetical protein [Aggregatilineales bacterium]
ASANPALMDVVQTLHAAGEARPGRDYINVYTLGEMRLNFFFPEMQTIWRDPLPTTLDELHQITDVLVAGTHADFLWEKTATYPNQISAMMDVGFHYSYAGTYLEYQGGNVMGTVFTPILYTDDGQHRFVAYNVYTPYRNYTIEELNPPYIFEDAQWDFIALRGMEFRRVIPQDSEQMRPDENGHLTLQPGEEYYLQLYWQRTDGEKPIPQDYSVFVQMIDPESHDILSQRDGALVDNNLPMTLMPYPDLIADRRRWKLPEDLPSGTVTLYIGIYDPDAADAPRVPVTGGQFAGADGILIENVLVIQ